MKELPKKNRHSTWLRFTGLSFQMAAIIALGFWLGSRLDYHAQSSKPWYTLSLGLIGVFSAIYLVVREVNSIKNDD